MTSGLKGRPGGRNTLTQRDVDQLLWGVAPYNFLRPSRISKDHRLQLEPIFSRFALSVQSTLSSRLRIPVDVTCTFEQATFSEYILSIGNPCAAFTFSLFPDDQRLCVLDLSTDLAFFILDRLFGGPGEMGGFQRALTVVERTVARGIVDKMVAHFKEAWQDHLVLSPEVAGFESTPEMLQITSPEDNVLAANLEVQAGSSTAVISMCIPLGVLENYLAEKSSASRQPTRQVVPPVQQRAVETAVRGAQVDLVARLPMLKLSAREVASLKVGQVIQTSHPVDGPVELHVNGARRFLAHLGQYRRALGLRIAGAAPAVPAPASRATRGRIQ